MDKIDEALRERHNTLHQAKEMQISLGDIDVIKGDEKHRGKWNIGIADKLCRTKDGVIHAVGLRTSKWYIERPIQYLYPLKLHCDVEKQPPSVNTNAREVMMQMQNNINHDVKQ